MFGPSLVEHSSDLRKRSNFIGFSGFARVVVFALSGLNRRFRGRPLAYEIPASRLQNFFSECIRLRAPTVVVVRAVESLNRTNV